MHTFLKEARKWLTLKEPLTFVCGNESCDLDSAVCAVGLAYFYTRHPNISPNLLTNGERRFLPVMNITRENLPLKTEVTYFMKEHNINLMDLVCRDEVPTDLFPLSRFILVDHHVSNLSIPSENIIRIFDHRPIDKNAKFSEQCVTQIQEVGSCATLIANEVLTATEKSYEPFKDLLRFLRGPIIMDTINFSEAAAKARPLDVEVNSKIEQLLELTQNEREELFKNLLVAIADVSSLTPYQLLSKDLKIISDKRNLKIVAIPGYPLLVEEFLQKENAWSDVKRFATEKGCDIIVLMGVKKFPFGDIRRDLALVQFRDSQHGKQIVNAIATENAEYLQLREKQTMPPESIKCQLFEQQNIKASRKQVLPIIQKILDSE